MSVFLVFFHYEKSVADINGSKLADKCAGSEICGQSL
jgi:hypothetical protein